MKTLGNLKLIGVATLLVVGLAACDKQGPAETAGKQLDQTVEEAQAKISEAADKVSEEADKASEKLAGQGDKAVVGMNDAEITAKVKAAIFAEPGLKTLQISVDTKKGVVTLSGSVDTQQNSDSARALAGAVSGVQEVKNRLMIKSGK